MNKELKINGDELLQRVYDGNTDFTEDELCNLVYEYDRFDTEEGEDRRWSRNVTVILKIEDKYFLINFDQGLTENQEDSFYSQPEEVDLVETEKTIIVRSYNSKTK